MNSLHAKILRNVMTGQLHRLPIGTGYIYALSGPNPKIQPAEHTVKALESNGWIEWEGNLARPTGAGYSALLRGTP